MNKIDSAREKSDNIYLNETEVEAILNSKNLIQQKHEVVRDLFLVGCYTG